MLTYYTSLYTVMLLLLCYIIWIPFHLPCSPTHTQNDIEQKHTDLGLESTHRAKLIGDEAQNQMWLLPKLLSYQLLPKKQDSLLSTCSYMH